MVVYLSNIEGLGKIIYVISKLSLQMTDSSLYVS